MLPLAQVIIQRLNKAKVRYGNVTAIERVCNKALAERTRDSEGYLELYGTERNPQYIYVVSTPVVGDDNEEEEICFYADGGEWILTF